jgi:hypothetical protein
VLGLAGVADIDDVAADLDRFAVSIPTPCRVAVGVAFVDDPVGHTGSPFERHLHSKIPNTLEPVGVPRHLEHHIRSNPAGLPPSRRKDVNVVNLGTLFVGLFMCCTF